MVSGVKVWDPLHAGLIRSRLSERHPASGFAPPCALIHRVAKDAPCRSRQSRRLSRPSSSPPSARGSARAFPPPAGSKRAEADARRESRRPGMKGKRHGGRGDAMMEDRPESAAEGPRNAKITLSFPVSAGPLPASLTSSGYCRNGASSSSPHRRRPSSKSSDEGSLWKLDSTTDIKHRPFKPARHDSSPSSSPSSSSSSPMTAHALIGGKDVKSPPPLKCSKVSPETHFARSAPGPSGSSLAGSCGGDGWDERRGLVNGTASPSQAAQILFGLGASAYQRGGGEAEPKEKTTGRAAAKLGSPHGPRPGPHPPALHLPPPLPPPPPSEGLGAPPRSAPYSPAESVEPELICGVCRRLFSSAASLTVHMRLHRGSRALACRFCGKVFIHGKRLRSHEASCGAPGPPLELGPALAVRPKEEPLEEGEVRAGEGQTDTGQPRPEKKGGGDDDDAAAAGEPPAGEQSHFVKVVDGNVIYFCSVCERSYMTLSSLKRHSNVHSWRRRYPCRFCDKVFALAEYRTKHEVWHTGERRYQCIFCWDAFATYYNLKTHQKAIHGINPSLISSEKTANGGYKQKADALKLYRLLPMRSQKRPYKTYSHSLHDALLMSPAQAQAQAQAPPHPLPPMACALGPAELQSFISGVKPDPDCFAADVPAADGAPSPSFPRRTEPARARQRDGEAHGFELLSAGCSKTSASCKSKSHRAARATDSSSTPSVITYGHPKPSVIVHGAAVSSSVIVHSKQVAPASGQNELPDVHAGQHSHKGGSRSCKRRRRDCADGRGKRARDNSDAATRDTCLKSRKSHGTDGPPRSEPASPPAVSAPLKETGPLCQITVRIGEEAIVKRSISETDLRGDKSRSPPKAKKGPPSSAKAAHRRREGRVRRGREAQASKERAGQSADNSSDELREYNFRPKAREQDSDHDTEDNLWRPYYSYKPKKKARAPLQRFQSWRQRKLKFKRALRLKRRAERLKRRGDTWRDDDGGTEPPPAADERGCGRDGKGARDGRPQLAAASPPSPESPSGLKRRPWTTANVAECATCGCWFSSSGKRDQHELSHLLEFVCLFCRAAFPSRDKLEDHQRIQHPKPTDASSAPQKMPLAQQAHAPKPEKELQVDSSHCSPARLSRRALSRHTCPQCHKVCKTSSALGRHVRRHESGASPPGRQKEEDVPPPPQAAAAPAKGQVVSVISYSTAEPPKSAEPSSSPERRGQPTARPRQAATAGGPEAAERPDPEAQSGSRPEMNPTPAKGRLAPATPPPLQSVLVMKRPECLDYRTPGKRSLDRPASPARSMAAPNASSDAPEAPQTRMSAAAPPVSMATLHSSGRGSVTPDGLIMDRERRARSATLASLQDQSRSRSASPSEAQDLTMSSMLAREREREMEMERQTLRKPELEKRRERAKDKDRAKDTLEAVQRARPTERTPADPTAPLVPKEEPLSPVPSPQRTPCQSQASAKGPPSRRHAAKSPCRPALLAAAKQQARELERLALPGGGERPSAHALLLPRPPKATCADARHAQPAAACYPHQDYPLPLIAPDNYRPAKKQQDNPLLSAYPTGALPFGPLGKMMVPPGADLAKLPFYPDPYQLLYGSQLLAYPYNMAALPVALNVVAPGAADKVEPLPFLPAIFNYTAGAGPYAGAAPHPLVANPSFYGGGKKQRDGSTHKP